MSLEDLNKELYNPDSDVEKRARKENPFDPRLAARANPEEFKKEEVWIGGKKELGPNQKKAIKIALWSIAGIAFIGLLILGVYKFKQSAFSEDRVAITLEGPANIDSTQIAQYSIKYKNDNRAKLENASILLNYSENFQPESAENLQILSSGSGKIFLGEVKSREEKEIILKGKFYAPQDSLVYLRAVLEYTPSNFNSVFQTRNQLGVNIKTSPIFLEIMAPLEAADGNDVEYVIDYRNSSSRAFENVRVKVEYPEGFDFSSSDPRPAESNNFWYIGNINPNQEGKIKIKGSIKGSLNEGKIIKAFIGSMGSEGTFVIYTQNEKLTKMAASPLAITQEVNDSIKSSVNAGESLKYKIKYKNNGGIGIRDAIITAGISSQALDFSKLSAGKGFYDSSRETITWKASEIPKLANIAPGEEGEVTFSVPVLDRIPVKSENDKNFTITTVAKIDSPDIPAPAGSNKIIASNTLELKVNSKVALEVQGFYKDNVIENSGPIPPKVGEETSYTIHWRVVNISNDIADVKIVSSLPTGVKWKGKFKPDSENLTCNERTNQLVWDIGKLKNGVGILSDKREVSFQISIIPQINQIGAGVMLLNPSILTARDLFTGEELRFEAKEKETNLTEDPSLEGRYKVQN